QTQWRVSHDQIQVTAVRTALQRLVTPRASTFFKTEEHGADECHECAFAGLVRPVQHIQAWIQPAPGLVVPKPETFNVDRLNSHAPTRRDTSVRNPATSRHPLWMRVHSILEAARHRELACLFAGTVE